MLLTVTDDQREGRFLAMGLALVLLVQSFLTFSRGGLYNFAIALIISIFHLLAKPNRFVRSIFTLSLLLLLMIAFILPQLEQLTGGMLSKRFSDTDVSSRKALVKADFQIFSENQPSVSSGWQCISEEEQYSPRRTLNFHVFWLNMEVVGF